MSKKSTKIKSKKPYKKKFKGVKYIALKLNKYFKKKYPKYTDALPKAREIFDNFKQRGEKVTVKNIFGVTRKKQLRPFSKKAVPPSEAPELPEELSTPTHFFDLGDYPPKIATAPDNLYFRSTISPSGLEDIQGGVAIDYTQVYEDYFKDFVTYINKLKAMTDPDLKIYEQEWFVRCLEPELDEKTGKWISLIVSTDVKGEQDNQIPNYGFDPTDPNRSPDESLLGLPSMVSGEPSGEKPVGGKKTSGEFKGTLEFEQELKLSKQRTKQLAEENEKLREENEKTRLSQRQQELDMRKVELGLMTKKEFRKIWS